MLTTFLNTLATIISVTSRLIVTYGALIGIISFLSNEFKRFTGKYSTTISGGCVLPSQLTYCWDLNSS